MLNPLVSKMLESTYQQAADVEVIFSLEFEPDNSCEAVHSRHEGTPCAGTATHWQECTMHKDAIKKVCTNVVKFWQEHAYSICASCSDQHGSPVALINCWSYAPIEK